MHNEHKMTEQFTFGIACISHDYQSHVWQLRFAFALYHNWSASMLDSLASPNPSLHMSARKHMCNSQRHMYSHV